jgi:flagellar hook-length control protein FliK
MIIESANLLPLASNNSVTVENISQPLADGVVSEGFSNALVAQIGLLGNMKVDSSLSQQMPDANSLQELNSSQGVVVGLSVGNDVQDFAALLGNDLPLSYKTKDDVDHEAALAAVTDTLKYIAAGTTAVEKAAAAEQNMKDVIAMVVPVVQKTETAEQNMRDVIAMVVPVVQKTETAVPVEQGGTGEIITTAPAVQNMPSVVAAIVSSEQNIKNADAIPVSVEQGVTDATADSGQGAKDIVVEAPVQMDLEQGSGKSDKRPVEDDAHQIEVANDNSGTEAMLAVATIILAPVTPVEQVKTAGNLTPDAIDNNGVSSFVKTLTGDVKTSQPAKASENILQAETISRQPLKDKQGLNLNSFLDSGQTEKAGRVDQQVLSFDGEKTLVRAGADMVPSNRVIDNKTDIPAITKPLSHPEWNKDLGDRIVWMSNKAIPSAEIRLNPQHLGPISVRVNVADDQATVAFTAQHAAVRETLEASIPKLREMMGAQQLNLVDVSVSQGPASDQGRSQSQNFAQTADGRGQGAMAVVDEIDGVEQEIASGRAVVSNGLLSIYA